MGTLPTTNSFRADFCNEQNLTSSRWPFVCISICIPTVYLMHSFSAVPSPTLKDSSKLERQPRESHWYPQIFQYLRPAPTTPTQSSQGLAFHSRQPAYDLQTWGDEKQARSSILIFQIWNLALLSTLIAKWIFKITFVAACALYALTGHSAYLEVRG